jgi:hypothetical protein
MVWRKVIPLRGAHCMMQQIKEEQQQSTFDEIIQGAIRQQYFRYALQEIFHFLAIKYCYLTLLPLRKWS